MPKAPQPTADTFKPDPGDRASQQIDTMTLSLTPYETVDLSIIWRCGNAPQPTSSGGAAYSPMGTAGGGQTAAYVASTVPVQFLPATCRL